VLLIERFPLKENFPASWFIKPVQVFYQSRFPSAILPHKGDSITWIYGKVYSVERLLAVRVMKHEGVDFKKWV
jgi:hypothetical protein